MTLTQEATRVYPTGRALAPADLRAFLARHALTLSPPPLRVHAMQYTTLPGTDLKVSKVCLGTMTWGQQNSEAEAHRQLDYAIGQGINFIDTAEMYPVPPNAATQGSTERMLGTWLARQKRDRLYVATKVAG